MSSADLCWSLTVTVAAEQVTVGMVMVGRLERARDTWAARSAGTEAERKVTPSQFPGQRFAVTQNFAIGDDLIRFCFFFCHSNQTAGRKTRKQLLAPFSTKYTS
jgi:hypothetical protein